MSSRLDDQDIKSALRAAVARGVHIRMVFEGASEDRKDPAKTPSAELPDLGIDVRWVNKIMHHKFAIIDGVQDRGDQPADATLISGSAN